MPQDSLPWTPDFESYGVEHRITEATVNGQAVRLRWDDGQTSEYHAFWLRENSPDEETIHPQSREMLIDPLDIPEDITPVEVAVAANGALAVTWSHGGRISRYHPGWLRRHAWLGKGSDWDGEPALGQVLWNGAILPEPPTYDGPEALRDDQVLLAWLEALRDFGVARLGNLAVRDGQLEDVLARIGPIRTTNFGQLFDVIVMDDPNSNAYTSAPLVPHMDLGTREMPPGLQFLFCRENSTSGGEGIYVDGYSIAEDLRREDPATFADLTTVRWEFNNRAKDCDYRAVGPVLALDANGALSEVRYTPWLRAPLKAPIDIQERAYRSIRAFMRRNADPANQIRITYRPGDLLAFDNRRVLHGRAGYSASGGKRHLQGCYADRDDLMSAIRLTRRRLEQGADGLS